jgi:hypothetical protein
MISPVKSAVGPGYGALDERLAAAVHLRFGLPSVLPGPVKAAIKRADRVSAWMEAINIAGFRKDEADRLFGTPEADVVLGLSIQLRPPVEVRAAFLKRHHSLLSSSFA